uniref:Uncharacterized protein n=1 Tax=viral metagenome TaxID=1070528 RepID=A0A6M3XJJ8_9ZZZZ
MSTTITPESKNALSVTNENKGQSKTWATVDGTWADHKKSQWQRQRTVITEESKNALSITNESKN